MAYVHSSSYRPTLLNPQQFQAVASNIKGSAALQSSCNNIRNSYKNDSVVRTNSLGSNSTSTTVSAAPTEKLSAANLPTEEQRNLLKDLILAASSVKSDSYSVSNNYVAAVLHLLYNLNSDFVADNETTRSVWLLLKRTGTDEHLKKFRLFIQSSNNFHSGTSDGNGTSSTITGFSSDVHGEASHGRQFTFSMKEIDEIIAYNLQKSKVQEAVFWYQIGQENYQLTPTKNTFNMLIPATVTKLNSWDTYYYLYNSMKSSGYELDKKRLEIVLTAACARPHYRWRDIISVLMDVVNR